MSKPTDDSSGTNRNFQRRASFSPSGSSLTDFFSSRSPPTAYPGPITTAAAQANQRRRLSISAGLTGTSPVGPTSPTWPGYRRESMSSASSTNSNKESPFDDDDASPGSSPQQPMGSSFTRRMSFGAKALRDAQTGRPLSIGASTMTGVAGKGRLPDHPEEEHHMTSGFLGRARRESVSTMLPPTSTLLNNPPQQPKPPIAPDSMGERMLKNDFYMD